MMPTVYTEDLVEELESRGRGFAVDSRALTELVTTIYEKRRLDQNYQQDLDQLIYVSIGKII